MRIFWTCRHGTEGVYRVDGDTAVGCDHFAVFAY